MMNLSKIHTAYDKLRGLGASTHQGIAIVLAIAILAYGPALMQLNSGSAGQAQVLGVQATQVIQGAGFLEAAGRHKRAMAAVGSWFGTVILGIGGASMFYAAEQVGAGYAQIGRVGVGIGLFAIAIGLGALGIWLMVRNHRYNKQYMDDHTVPFDDHSHDKDHVHPAVQD